MKRFRAAVAIVASIVCAAGANAQMGSLGFSGNNVIGGGGSLPTPTITPQVSSNFDPTNNYGLINHGLAPNNGTAGAFVLPQPSNTGSWFIYAEALVDPALRGGERQFMLGNNSQGLFIDQSGVFTLSYDAGNGNWWSAQGPSSWNVGATTTPTPTGYAHGFYPFTATGGNCAREPAGVWNWPEVGNKLGSAAIVDPGFLCSAVPTVNVATIPGIGAQQATGPSATPSQAATTCAVVNGIAQVTAHVAIAHGINPGLTYTMQGFTPSGAPPSGYNATYTALPGTSGTTLIGATGATSCPGIVTFEGTALSGTGATITLPALSGGQTGIRARNGQHICVAFGEYGTDSPFPGAQFMTAVDERGNALPGPTGATPTAPALVSWLNLGTANATGSIAAGDSTAPRLTVSAMPSYALSGATYSGTTGYVTFTVSPSPNFIPGSEFTVTGVSPSGYNHTYVAIGPGTSGTTVVGNPLSGPAGTLQAITNPGPFVLTGSPQMVSVILPGMQVQGAVAGTIILPYGTAGGTGTGGAGTYAMSGTQSAVGSGALFIYPGFYYSASGGVATPRSQAGVDFINMIGQQNNQVALFQQHGGWAGSLGNVSMLYGFFPQQTGGAPDTTKLASLCKKTTDIQSFAAANSLTVHSLYRLNDPGIWADSGAASFTGYITNSGGTSATLNVSSMQYGALTGSGTVKIAGPGVPGCPASCPTASLGAGPTYALTPNTIGALGSSGSPVAMTAGTYNPATPLASNTFNGYTDACPLGVGCQVGVPTLHVTSVNTAGTFNGTLASFLQGFISGTTLTVTYPPDQFSSIPALGIGTIISGPGVTPTTVTALGPGARGYAGTYTVSVGQTVGSSGSPITMQGGGVLPGYPGALTVNSVASGSVIIGELVTDGGASITGQPLLVTGGSSPLFNIGFNYYPAINSDAAMAATIATPVPGQYLLNAAITTPVKIIANGTLTNCPTTGFPMCGTYLLSTAANGNVGTAGSPVAFISTGITDGGAIAPGSALTVRDLGPGVTFPVTNFGSGTGTLFLSGTYDTATLGGAPSAIQAQVSNTANGPPISGCAACAWTNLSSSVASGGSWSGQAVNIPASGGPLYVSVRAANGTAYATMPNYIKVGLVFDLQGNGIGGGLSSGQSGTAINYFTGLWGINQWADAQSQYVNGPPVLANYSPGQTLMYAGDRFGITGSSGPVLSEAIGAFEQPLTNASGWPVTFAQHSRDGIGVEPDALGNIQQNQTIAVADGTRTTWCSSTTFCPSANVSVAGPLFFNAAAMTGATMNGASITSGVLSVPAAPSGATPSGAGLAQGALEPGMVLTGTSISIPGGTTLVNCVTGCTISAYPSGVNGPLAAQTWATSNPALTVGAETIRADLPGGSPWPTFALQQAFGMPFLKNTQAFGIQLIQAGTFKISVNGTVVCQDTQTFAYNNLAGNCTGASIASSFVNYLTGDYSVTFSIVPAANAVITASWTNIISPEPALSSLSRPTGIDMFGNGTFESGPISSMFAKTPGGSNGHIYSGCSTNANMIHTGNIPYQFLAPGYSQMVSWLYNTRYPTTIPGVSVTTPFISANETRTEGTPLLDSFGWGAQLNCSAWARDIALKSTFSGTISSNLLTLSGAAVGQMWEGEVLGGTGVPQGMYITSLASGVWGASGSTYSLAGASGVTIATPTAMSNAVYYQGSAPTIYAGALADQSVQAINGLAGVLALQPHVNNGFAGGRRVTARWAAEIWEWLNAAIPISTPTLDRVKADAVGCDTSAIAAPCFDIGNTYAAAATTTAITGKVLTFNGLAAHARPIVVGQAAACTGCSAGLFVTAVSNPPTQSTVAGAGQIGAANNGMTVTLNAVPGVTQGPGRAVTFGCAGTAGTGSNCIDIAVTLNAPGATALDTCGANNLNGTAQNYNIPFGTCVGSGIGEIVRDFRIGTTQGMLSFTAGSFYEDGIDQFNNMQFNQSAAFTCNIVAAKVVQCVKGPVWTSGVPTAVGQWLSSGTYIEYGEPGLDAGSRIAQVMGYAGGQSFPFTAGSGYTNGVHTIQGTGCGVTGGGTAPTFDVWVSGTAIVDVYPSATTSNAAGAGIGTSCTLSLASAVPAMGAGSGGVIPPIALAPLEGVGGIGTYNTDSNNTGVLLYDNSGEVGNPLNSFFTNGRGGYFEPGLPVQPSGGFQGLKVSG